MRKLFFLTAALLCSVLSQAGITKPAEQAVDFVKDGIRYTGFLNERFAIVTGVDDGIYTLTIPTYVTDDGIKYPVHGIDKYALEGTDLQKLTIDAEYFSYFGEGAMQDCKNLLMVEFKNTSEEGVTIGESAFARSGLQGFETPKLTNEIKTEAFADCNDMLTVTINDTKTIDPKAFWGCEKLYTLNWNNNILDFTSDEYITPFPFLTKLIRIVTLNANTPAYLFAGFTALETVYVYENTEEIDNFAFYDTPKLTRLSLARATGLTSIGDHAFEKSNINHGLNFQGDAPKLKYIGNSAFKDSKITSINLGNSETDERDYQQIAKYAFMDCKELQTIRAQGNISTKADIWSGETSMHFDYGLDQYAFYGCDAVTKLYFGPNDGIDWAVNYEIDLDGESTSPFVQLTNLQYVEMIAENTSNYAFYKMKSLKTVFFTSSKNIGMCAFEGCSHLSKVTFYSSIEIDIINTFAFADCTSLTTFNSPNTLRYIADGAFTGCTALSEFTFGEKISYIGGAAFAGCKSLGKTVTIPETIATIGSGAYMDCGITTVNWNAATCNDILYSSPFDISLHTINFGDNVKSIPGLLCEDLTNIKEITIPASVTYIGQRAFRGCTALTTINALPVAPPRLGAEVFKDLGRELTSITLTTPNDDAYSRAAGWRDFFEHIYESYYTLSVSADTPELGEAYILDGETRMTSLEFIYGSTFDFDVYATPKQGAVFINWTLNGEEYSTDAHIHISNGYVARNEEYVAHFQARAETVAENGLLAGQFSVSADEKVQFSQGNLIKSGDEYRFADYQYYYISTLNSGAGVSLFAWDDKYGTEAITNGGNEKNMWRMLTKDEWVYLFEERENAAALSGPATIGRTHGYVLLPDDWTLPDGLSFNPDAEEAAENAFSFLDWSEMEKAGAVFLPCAGVVYENEEEVWGTNSTGAYWTATKEDDTWGYSISFSDIFNAASSNELRNLTAQASIRLVKNNNPTGIDVIRNEGLNLRNDVRKVIYNGQLYILRDGNIYNALGVKVE